MRVGMIVHAYFPRDSRVRRAANALIEAGHEVDVVCLRDREQPPAEVWKGVTIHRLPIRRRRGAAMTRYLGEYAAFAVLATIKMSYLAFRRRYHIVHVHNMPDLLVFAGIVPALLGARVVLDMHDPMPELLGAEPGMARRKWVVPILDLEERVSCRFADFVITVSDPMKERLIDRDVSPDRVGVVMNLPDGAFLGDLAAAVSSQATVPPARRESTDRPFLMVYAGTVSERHGLDVAVEAIHQLRTEMPDLQLVVAGEGPHLSSLQRHAHDLALDDRVRLLGLHPPEEIASLLTASDLGISCHGNDEFWRLCFPSKVVEALAAGLPVISSRTHTIERYLDDSVLFFFRPGDVDGFVDQVRTVRRRPELVEAKRKAAAIRLAELNWDREKTKLLEILSRVANS